jgi:hypothetical protein
MEAASPAGSERAATGGRETKAKTPKKVLTQQVKYVEAAKRRGRCKNPKERKDVAALEQ